MNEKYQWNFTDIYESDEVFLNALQEFKTEIDQVDFSSLNLEDKLTKYYELALIGERLLTYAELKSDLDVSNETYLQYKNQVYSEKSKLDPMKNEINKQILQIDQPLDEYMKEHPEALPFYMHFYNIYRLKEHVSNSKVVTNENQLIQKVNNLYNTIMNVEMPCESIELDGKETKVTRSIYNKYIMNQDRHIRESVFKAFMKSLRNVNKSISSLFLLRYQMCYDVAKELGYHSILEQVITEDDLDMKIIDDLIASVHDHLPLLHQYIELKKEKMGMDEIHYYDLNINYDYNPRYSFDEAVEIVKEALKGMGEEYQKLLNQVLDGGMLDVFPSEHKFSGGYHFRNYIKPMILMNYRGNFREVPTIGHELGHAVNGLLTKANQNYQDFHFSLFLSEIASTVNEEQVEKYLYEKAKEEDKIVHLEQIIDKTIASIFSQTLFLELQKELCTKIEHGESLTSNTINQTYLALLQKYYQGLILDEDIKYLWQTKIHLFYGSYRYYNFQYATGKIASLVINKHVQEGKLDDYLKFLTIGGSKPTLEALSQAGVDLTKREVYDDAMNYLGQLLDEYKVLIKK